MIEIADLYQAGNHQFNKKLAQLPDIDQVWQNSRGQVLLIMMTVAYDDGEFEQVQQTGVFVAKGHYVLTAGHGFFIEEGRIIGVRAETISGQKLDLDLVKLVYDEEQKGFNDWAILEPKIRFMAKGMDIAQTHFDENVLVLGFPGSLGLDDIGQVVHIHEVERGTIYPLGIIAERLKKRQHILRPNAGAIPIKGMSGGPVIDHRGDLVGIFSSVRRSRSITGWSYIMEMSNIPINSLDSLLAE